MANETDERIRKAWWAGCSIERIAKKIGRPGDVGRVREGLARMKIDTAPRMHVVGDDDGGEATPNNHAATAAEGESQ